MAQADGSDDTSATRGDVAASADIAELRAALGNISRQLAEIRQLVGPFGVPLRSGEVLVQTLFGVKYLVPDDDLVMLPQLVVYRQWEMAVSQLILAECDQGQTFVDVGANLGYFTCLAASKLGSGSGSKVIALEPNPAMLRLLRLNIEINHGLAPVEVHACAAAAVAGELDLRIPHGHAANAAIVADRVAPEAEQPRAEIVRVQVVTVDEILRREARVDLVKVDVEGFEPAVFEGASETLERPGLRLLFEWSPDQMAACRQEPQRALDLLKARGFRLFDADERARQGDAAVELDADAVMRRGYMNLFAKR